MKGRVVVATILALGCGGSGKGVTSADGGSDGGSDGASGPDSAVFSSPLCRTPYPAQACDGDPHGRWTLAALCLNPYESCPGAVVVPSGTATATLEFQENGLPESYFEYQFDYDLETRLSVPASCLGGASCEAIGCFAGEDPCSCVRGSSRGGTVGAEWTPNISGEVVATYSDGTQNMLRFCAGATTADSLMGGTRVIWNRVCVENMDCRPSNPCHFGTAHCAGGGLTCEDTGSNRAVGATCGADRVCDASGACVACAAGAACQIANQPCKTGIISCRTAAQVCVADANLADGASCGVKRTCLGGVCKSDDGESCNSNAECRTSCTCGDAQCTTRHCGRSCPCGYAPPGGACAGLLADGTRDAGSCNKACFQGRCLTEIGQLCTGDSQCGSGHCTCWSQTCSGGRLCSRMACPCQWASSGADTCSGPLMDGLMDYTCRSPQMCVQGMCN